MRFDAYAGNVYGGTRCSEVAEMVAIASHARVERGKPRGRYNDVFDIKDGSQPVGWIGRDQMLETAYFEFKGERTPLTSEAIRKHCQRITRYPGWTRARTSMRRGRSPTWSSSWTKPKTRAFNRRRSLRGTGIEASRSTGAVHKVG